MKKEKQEQNEIDIKFLLIASFVAIVMAMVIGIGDDKFRWWGVEESIVAKGQIGLFSMISYHIALILMIVVFIFFGHSKVKQWHS